MKNSAKKIFLVLLLVAIIGVIIAIAFNASSGKKEEKVSATTKVEKVSQSTETSLTENNVAENNTENEVALVESGNTKSNTLEAKVEKLSDGIKYSIGEEIEPEMVIGDNYFATQVLDMSVNFDQYEGKTVEIEGLYFENEPYTFVGRYSTSVVCPTCPTGYSYFEYEWHGDKDINLTDSEDWIKVVGTLKKGNDGVEYYYIDVSSIEVMNGSGLDTVVN